MNAFLIIKDKPNIKLNVNINKIKKMATIFHAIENGWTVKKLDNNSYEYTKNEEDSKIQNFTKLNLKTKDTLNILK